MLGELAPDGTSLLGPEIERQKLLLFVGFPQRGLLLLRDHRQHLRDPEPNDLAAIETTRFNPIE